MYKITLVDVATRLLLVGVYRTLLPAIPHRGDVILCRNADERLVRLEVDHVCYDTTEQELHNGALISAWVRVL